MAVTQTPRLDQTRWSAGIDSVSRNQFDSDAANLDSLVAIFLEGTLANRPPSGVPGRFYTIKGDSAELNERQYYDNGNTWHSTSKYAENLVATSSEGGTSATVRGISGQTEPLQVWQRTSGSTVASVSVTGTGSFLENKLGSAESALEVKTTVPSKPVAVFATAGGDLTRWLNSSGGVVGRVDSGGRASFAEVNSNTIGGVNINAENIESTKSSRLKTVSISPLAASDNVLSINSTDTHSGHLAVFTKGSSAVARLTANGRLVINSVIANYNVGTLSASAELNSAIAGIAPSGSSSAILGRGVTNQSAPIVSAQDSSGATIFGAYSNGDVTASGKGLFREGIYTTDSSVIHSTAKKPTMEVSTGSGNAAYKEYAVLRHAENDTTAVAREIVMAMKLSDEVDATESAKFAGTSAYSDTASAGSAKLGLYANGNRVGNLDGSGKLTVAKLAANRLEVASGSQQSVVLADANGSIAGIGTQMGRAYLRSAEGNGMNFYSGGTHDNNPANPGGGALIAQFSSGADNRLTTGSATLTNIAPIASMQPVLRLGAPEGNHMQFSANSVEVFSNTQNTANGNLYLNYAGTGGKVNISGDTGHTEIRGRLETPKTIEMSGRKFTVDWLAPSNPSVGDVWININGDD